MQLQFYCIDQLKILGEKVMKIRYLDNTGNRIELSGEIDKNYVIAPGKKVTFAEGSKFQGKPITTNQGLYNNEYIPKTIGMSISGKLALVIADPPSLIEPDSAEESELDEFDYGLERLDDQYRKLQDILSSLQKENTQLKACIADARLKAPEEKSQGGKFDPAKLTPLNIPPETQKFPIIHFQPFSPDEELSPGALVRDSSLRSISVEFNPSSARNFPSPVPLERSETINFDDWATSLNSPTLTTVSLVRRSTILPEEMGQILESPGDIQPEVQVSLAPGKELERDSSSSSLIQILDESGLSATPASADPVADEIEQEIDVSGASSYSRDEHSFCGIPCAML